MIYTDLYKKLPVISSLTRAEDLTKLHKTSKIILLTDHMPLVNDIKIHDNHKKTYIKNSYIEIFQSAGIDDYNEKIFLTDHYLKFENLNKMFLYNSHHVINCIDFNREYKNFYPVIKKKITKNLTFLSNKPRPHRILTSMVLANLFKDKQLSYTYIPDTNETQSIIVDELLIDTDYNFSKKFLEERYFKIYEDNVYVKNQRIANPGTDWKHFRGLVSAGLFDDTALSIILEPSYYEAGVVFTEKTLMAIYVGHFLIWPGGYKSAEVAKSLGLDVFEDIIDHSYQYIEHPGKRVVEAILRNQTILLDKELQEHLRNKNIERLQKNVLMVQNIHQLQTTTEKLQIGKIALSDDDKALIYSVIKNE